jgi:hypothetical protein
MLRPFYDASVRDSRCSSVSSRNVVAPTGPGPGSEDHQDEHRESGLDGTITPKPTKDSTLARPAQSRSTSSASKSATTTSSGRSRSVSATCSRRILMGIKSEESTRPVVENHGAGTHFVCQDEAGLAGPYDALSEFDQVSRSVAFLVWHVSRCLFADSDDLLAHYRSNRSPYNTLDRQTSC